MTPSRLRPLLSGVVLRSQSDARLAQLAGDGHQLAFTTIFERYQHELAAHASGIVRPGRAEDVVQHAMLNAWSALLSGEAVLEPRAWLHRIVHNVALNTVARRGYDDSEIPQAIASPMLTADIAEWRLSAAEALAGVAALPDAQRRALTLTALHGRSGADAAAEMGVSESAMRQLIYRARHRMRSAVSAVTPLPFLMSAIKGAGASGAATVSGAGTGGALSGVAAKTAVVLAVATGGVSATTVVSHNNDRHARTPHAHATTPTPLAAPAPPGVDVAPKRARPSSTRPSQHSHPGSSRARHGRPTAHSDRGADGSNTSGQTTANASQRSAGTQSSSGENAGERDRTPPKSYDDSSAPAAQSASAGDDTPTLPTSLQSNDPDASTSPDIDDGPLAAAEP